MTSHAIREIDARHVDRDHVRQLCEALESGQYEQARQALKDNGGFCCLGVACDIVDSTRWVKFNGPWYYLKPNVNLDDYDEDGRDGDGDFMPSSTEYPTYDIISWYGFADENPEVYVTCDEFDSKTGACALGVSCDSCHGAADRTGISNLSTLNDDFSWSFVEIAAALRLTYLKAS
jgi:hypothetical protein